MLMRVNLSADIPESLRKADDLLHRYGRWAMDRRRQHRCGSAESAYRPERGEAVEARRAPREMLLPTPDALLVHRALIQVAESERRILHMLYVPNGRALHVQLRKSNISPSLCRERHLVGLRMFLNYWTNPVQSPHRYAKY